MARLSKAEFGAAVAGFWAAVFGAGWWLAHFIARPGDSDLHNYVAAALVGFHHGWSRIYDLGLQQTEWTTYTAGMGQLPFIYRAFASPPVVAWIALPFAAVPLPVAYVVWTGLIVASLVITWRVCARGSLALRLTQLGLALVVAPIAWELQLGSVTAFVMVAAVASLPLLRERRDVAAGVVLVAILLKPNIAFLVPLVPLVTGHRRAFVVCAVASVVLVLMMWLSLGSQGTAQFLAVLKREDALRFNWYLSLAQVTGPGTPQLIASALVAAGGVAAMIRRRIELEACLAAALLASVCAAPYIHAQDFALLLPAGWLAWRAEPSALRWATLALVPAGVLVFLSGSLPLLIVSLALLAILGWRRPYADREFSLRLEVQPYGSE